MTEPEGRRLLTVDEAAGLAGMHQNTIRRYVKDGLLTEYRKGRKFLRVDADEVATLTKQAS